MITSLWISSNSCVTCCCYKLLENPTISHVKSKPTRDAVIHLLGLLIKKYNHLLGKPRYHQIQKTWKLNLNQNGKYVQLVYINGCLCLTLYSSQISSYRPLAVLHRCKCQSDSVAAALWAAVLCVCSGGLCVEHRVWSRGNNRRGHKVRDNIYSVLFQNAF